VVGDDNVASAAARRLSKKRWNQWFFKITDYTERLLDDLETVDWPQKVKTMQVRTGLAKARAR
jgi:leucyl-tRNA synthetase